MKGAFWYLPEVVAKTLGGKNRIHVFRDLVFQADAAASGPAIMENPMDGITAIPPGKKILKIICLA